MTKEKTLKEHMRDAVRARWAKTTKEERSAYGKMMADRKKAKRANTSEITVVNIDDAIRERVRVAVANGTALKDIVLEWTPDEMSVLSQFTPVREGKATYFGVRHVLTSTGETADAAA